MLAESRRNLEQHGISHRQVLLSGTNPLTKRYLDDIFNENEVLLMHGDAKDVQLPKQYFDVSVIYCTLPNMDEKTQAKVLKTMKKASKRVLISIYKPESLPKVLATYKSVGEKGKIEDDTLKLDNGLIYRIVPLAYLQRMFKRWNLKVHDHPFGLVYDFTH